LRAKLLYTRFENEKVSRPLTAHRQAHMNENVEKENDRKSLP